MSDYLSPPLFPCQASYKSHTLTSTTDIYVSTEYLVPGDRVLIIDDFLAGGRTADALVRVCRMANANVVGGGFLIEKLQASLKPTPLLVYPTFTRLAHPTFYPVGTPDLTDSSAHSPSKFNEQDAGRAFLSGYQIPLESLATVSIADDRIEVIDLEGEVEEDDIDEIEEIVLIDEANNLEEIDQIEADEIEIDEIEADEGETARKGETVRKGETDEEAVRKGGAYAEDEEPTRRTTKVVVDESTKEL